MAIMWGTDTYTLYTHTPYIGNHLCRGLPYVSGYLYAHPNP